MRSVSVRLVALAGLLLLARPPVVLAAQPCRFNHQDLMFEGSSSEQARCLLRNVRPYGELDAPLAALPAPLDKLIGTTPEITLSTLRAYLTAHAITEAMLGGSLELALSYAKAGDANAPHARYFVIHDTSKPALGERKFPRAINQASWSYNKLNRWLEGDKSRAHVFISRTGQSVTPVNFSEAWRATKFEMQDTLLRRKGLFLHIELVTPRRNDPDGPKSNNALAPPEGFPAAQYERLALVYLAASLRSGVWMIPAFHAVLDAGRVDAHDDPQNFSTLRFGEALAQLLTELQTTPKTVNAH